MTGTNEVSTLPAAFAATVATRGQHPAVATEADTLSYQELDRRSAEMACALLAVGAGKGTRIALMAPDGILWVTSFLASLRIGALLTTVSTMCTPPELAYILRTSDAQILIGVTKFLRHDYVAKLTEALPGLNAVTAGALRLPAAPYLRSIWLEGAEGLGWARPIADLLALAMAPDAPDALFLAAVEREVTPSDDACVVYTSGSTSTPKAVMHSHRTLSTHAQELAKYFLLRPSDRMMPLLPAFWIGGLFQVAQVLNVGATLVYPASPDVETVLSTIEHLGINRLNSWGHMLTQLREAATARGIEIDKIVGLGPFRDATGEVIPPPLQTDMLGMSETFGPHSAEPLDVRLPCAKAGAAGRAISNFERRAVDQETGREVPPGAIGELQVRGGGLMTGFYKKEASNVFTPDGYYATKDLVRIDETGYLFFVGRIGDMIKTKAANVSRLEVEAALRALPEVDLPIVTGLPDPEFGQVVVAAVVPVGGTSPSEESLRTALRLSLSGFKVPRHIVLISHDDVPYTSTGKVKLFEIATLIGARIGRAVDRSVFERQSVGGVR